jgi:hypothetical protein
VKHRGYSDGDIVKVIARIQREHGFDFRFAPSGRDPEDGLRDIVSMANELCDAFPGVSQKRLVRCLMKANDQKARLA